MLTVLFFEFTGKFETFYDKKLKRTHYNLVLSHAYLKTDSCEQRKTSIDIFVHFLCSIFTTFFKKKEAPSSLRICIK